MRLFLFLSLLLSVAPPLFAEAVLIEVPQPFPLPTEGVPPNVEWAILDLLSSDETNFLLQREDREETALDVEVVSERYLRLSPVTPLISGSTYTLSDPTGISLLRSIEFVVTSGDDITAPSSVVLPPPEKTAPNTPSHFLTNIASDVYRYRFAVEESLADVVVAELRNEDTNEFIGVVEVAFEFPVFLDFFTISPLEGTFALDLVDAAGNRTRTNSVELSSGCSSSAVPSSALPPTVFALIGFLCLGLRRRS